MTTLRPCRWLAVIVLCFPLGLSAGRPQDGVVQLPTIVVTATRGPLDVSRAGSAIDVLSHEEIERLGATSVRDVLQSVPGLYAHDGGGVGALTSATLRGSNPGQTLVLIDGVRVGNPTATDGAFDFGNFAITDIERIEVLRGPQSALYGSDAMGGVIQIITRKGEGAPKRSLTVEGGSYGTLRANGSISGGFETSSYAFAVDLLHSDGYPRYGYRPNHPIFLGDGVTPLPKLPRSDPTNRAGATGRVSYQVGEATEIELGFGGYGNRLTIDNPFAFAPENVFDRSNFSRTTNGYFYTKATNTVLDGRLTNRLALFGSAIDSVVAQTESCPEDFFTSRCRTNYRGVRVGAEYQGDLKLGAFGLLTFGLRNETERAFFSHDLPLNLGAGHVSDFSGQQTTNSAFALYQFTLFDRLDVSVAGREDKVESGPSFLTGRATAAWRLNDEGTKLRASVGSGAKIPTLYQRYSFYGDATLKPEETVGWDVGVDQTLIDNRLQLSASFFNNRYRNLINFTFSPAICPPMDINGCYFNVGQAMTQGVEFSAKADLVPNEWRATASYTYMDAINKITSQGLLQQPRHKAVASLIYTGIAGLRVEGRVTTVAGVLDFGTVAPVLLPAYYRLDAFVDYKINSNLKVFARLENLTDARYEEVYNYSVAGRSIYAGVKVSW
jgi:vitamin B12 transporter